MHVFGTGFIVIGKARNKVIDFKPINERMCVLRIRGRFHNYSLICVHAPTEDKDNKEKEAFYDMLEKVYETCPKFDIKICLGDYNAKVGKEAEASPNVGQHSLHDESNINGEYLVNYAVSQKMTIVGTEFPHRNILKATWRSPDGCTSNQIDHILIDSRHFNNILDVRSYRGANADSDHYILIGKTRCRISTNWKVRTRRSDGIIKYNTQKFNNIDTQMEYRGKNDENLQSHFLRQ